jgi:hypothetical protein
MSLKLMGLIPKSLHGQLLLLLLGGIFIAHVVGVIVFYLDSPNAIQLAIRNQLTDRLASAIRVTEFAPQETVSGILSAMSSPDERFWVDVKRVFPSDAMTAPEAELAAELNRKIDGNNRGVSSGLANCLRVL